MDNNLGSKILVAVILVTTVFVFPARTVSAATNAGAPGPSGAEGWTVILGDSANPNSATVNGNVGSKAWSDPDLGGKGWVHNSHWVVLTAQKGGTINLSFAANGSNLVPALTVWKSPGFNFDGNDGKSYNNFGTPWSGAKLSYVGSASPGSGAANFSFDALPCGQYTIALGGNDQVNAPHGAAYTFTAELTNASVAPCPTPSPSSPPRRKNTAPTIKIDRESGIFPSFVGLPGSIQIEAEDAEDDNVSLSLKGKLPKGDFSLLELFKDPGSTVALITWTPTLADLGTRWKFRVIAKDDFKRPKRSFKTLEVRVLPQSLIPGVFYGDFKKLTISGARYDKVTGTLTVKGVVLGNRSHAQALDAYQVGLFETKAGTEIGKTPITLKGSSGLNGIWSFTSQTAPVCEVLAQVDDQFAIKKVKGLTKADCR